MRNRPNHEADGKNVRCDDDCRVTRNDAARRLSRAAVGEGLRSAAADDRHVWRDRDIVGILRRPPAYAWSVARLLRLEWAVAKRRNTGRDVQAHEFSERHGL